MSTHIQHCVDIDAPPAAVWEVLIDTPAYADWNPFVRRLTGTLRVGSRLEVDIAPPGGRPMTFKPTVLTADPERELRWLGRLLAPGVFDGEHVFRLQPLPDGRTRLTQSECFRGLLARLLAGTLAKTRLGFEQMNVALKHRVEAREMNLSVVT